MSEFVDAMVAAQATAEARATAALGPDEMLASISLRDYFAGQALSGLLARDRHRLRIDALDARLAYQMADVMMQARRGHE